MRIGTREGTVVLKEGRKGAEGDPESGEAGPSAERSEALLSGGRTVAPRQGAGSAPTPSASTCKRDDRVRREHGGPSSGASEGRAPSAPQRGVRSGEIGPPREPSQEHPVGGAATWSPLGGVLLGLGFLRCSYCLGGGGGAAPAFFLRVSANTTTATATVAITIRRKYPSYPGSPRNPVV